VRFDELILQEADDELRVRFHPQLTMLSGLGQAERRSLADGLLASLTGEAVPTVDATTLTYTDGTGRSVTLHGRAGSIESTAEDGSTVAPPIGTLVPDARALRRLVLVAADDLGGLVRRSRDDEPPELREARDMLEELTLELDAALGQEQAVAGLQTLLDSLEEELRAARDGVARRAYAQVLAQLERVRAEAAALQSGTAGIEADRNLLANAAAARSLAAAWVEAASRVKQLVAELPSDVAIDPLDRTRLAAIPATAPEGLDGLIEDLAQARIERDALDHRLQDLAVAKLPAPSDPIVAELGLFDQTVLWRAAARLTEAGEAVQRVQLSLGGLDVDDMGPAATLIEEIEAAHSEVEAADRAAESARIPGMAGAGLGVTAGLLGLAAAPVLLPVGLVGAAVAAGAGLVRPQARRAKARRDEQRALDQAEATSYLGFHIRRVEASVDPKLRELVEVTTSEHRGALAAWTELVGPDVPVEAVCALVDEIRAYHAAVQNLGDTAEEMEQLRRQLDEQAVPRLTAATAAVLAACADHLVTEDDLEDPRALVELVELQCRRGAQARAELVLDDARSDEQKAAGRLDDLLLHLGFDAGELDARVGALEWAVTRAEEREDARNRARPRAEIDAELASLQETAARLRQPEWATVTAADAATPDIPELESRRDELARQLAAARAEVDIERLADRKAAVERRVSALEARLGSELSGDPGAVADIQQHLLARLTVAAQAAPHGDPVPVLLDEVLQRVPADRTWDMLDLLLRLAEHQQLIYLTDDAFVAAWARQRALDGTITLLELAPEPA
jgi:hypothetical protein